MNSKIDQPMKPNPLYLGYQSPSSIIPQIKNNVKSPFPADFFEEIKPKAKQEENENINKNYEYRPKSIKIDISKEDDEDRELISLLEEKPLTSQNKYKKKIVFDVIEEEDEDKNNLKNDNLKGDLVNNILKEKNMENVNENELLFDSKYSHIHSNANQYNKDIINDNDYQKNNEEKKIDLIFSIKIKNINENKNISKWNHSSNMKNLETDIFNKIPKDSSLAKQIIKESSKKKHLFLPNIKSQDLYERKSVSNKVIIDPINDLKNINFQSNKALHVNSNNYLNDNTQATTLITYSTKKFSNSKINNIKSMNTDLTQFGMGLISAGSTTNNNIIIPILTKTRPESNFNCGGGILKNFSEDFENNGKNRTIESNKNIRQNKSRNFRKKICRSQEANKRINASMKNKELCSIFPDIQKIIPNFHKIKIEKGMTNIKF